MDVERKRYKYNDDNLKLVDIDANSSHCYKYRLVARKHRAGEWILCCLLNVSFNNNWIKIEIGKKPIIARTIKHSIIIWSLHWIHCSHRNATIQQINLHIRVIFVYVFVYCLRCPFTVTNRKQFIITQWINYEQKRKSSGWVIVLIWWIINNDKQLK